MFSLTRIKSTKLSALKPGSRCVVPLEYGREVFALVLRPRMVATITEPGLLPLANLDKREGIVPTPMFNANLAKLPALDLTLASDIAIDFAKLVKSPAEAAELPGSLILQDGNAYIACASGHRKTTYVNLVDGSFEPAPDESERCYAAANWAIAMQAADETWKYEFKFDAKKLNAPRD